ncbi:MAG: preprotein translocase subunit YajC [Clostridia bacterium]|nr:preprotein translocase subunit YajC [Clostridia bacterium]
MFGFVLPPMAAAVSEGSAGALMSTLPLILLMVALLAFMIIPQRKRDKKVKEMLASLKPGDRVRTIGGIYGTITSVKEDFVVLQSGPDKIRLVFARGAISQIEEKGAENTMNESVVE